MRLRVVLLASVLLASPAPSWPAGSWYDYYLDAIDKDIPNKRWAEAIKKLKEARRLKPESALHAATYGLNFVPYFPYYYEGMAYLRSGEHATAIIFFNTEEKKGVIKNKKDLYRDLQKLRQEAEHVIQEAENAKRARRLRDEVERLRKEGAELHRLARHDEALSRLLEAQKAAEALDPGIQREILERIQKVREDGKRAADAAERAQRIEKDLGEGQRLMEQGQATEAKLRFDSVLALDPQNAKALEGQRRADEEILARSTQASREEAFKEGRALFEAGRYEAALRPLADAAADPQATQAQELLARARSTLEGLRRQKDLHVRIEQLMADAERLLAERRYSDAWVKLENVLGLDPTHVKAQERLRLAERMTREQVVSTLFPNQAPELTFLEPDEGAEGTVVTDSHTLEVVGVATDDRGLVKVEFLLAGRPVAEQSADLTGEPERNLKFDRQFELAPGKSELRVIAHDSLGLTDTRTFVIDRHLRYYETKYFWPSVLASAAGLMGLGYAVQRSRRKRAVRHRFNPYIAGAPVRDEDMFFGRGKLLTRILNVLHHNSLMITGERRIGKTTFLHHLKRALEKDEGTEYKFFPVSADLQGVPESGFFHSLMTDVVDQVKPKVEVLASLRFRPEEEAYDGRDFSHDLQRVVEDLKGRTPKKVKLALLIDEVDVLNEYSERINQRLRGIFMKTFSEHLVAVMSGVGIKRTWKSEGSPWYNFFDEIELTAFSREEAEALIREPLEGVFRYEPQAVEVILARSALKPYHIQKICIHAVNRMLEYGRTTVTTEDVTSVLETVKLDRGEDEEEEASVYAMSDRSGVR